jgi:hypothetical protein
MLFYRLSFFDKLEALEALKVAGVAGPSLATPLFIVLNPLSIL